MSVNTVHGDGTSDDSCPTELAAYEECVMSNQAVCDSECEQEPEFTEEVFASLMTDPSFLCQWLNEGLCAVQQCCNVCNKEANAYLSCLAKEFSEDGTCVFTCTDNGGVVDDGSDSDGGGGNVGADADAGDGVGEGSSASFTLSTMTVWAGLVMVVVNGLI